MAAQNFWDVFNGTTFECGALGYENRGPRLGESATLAIAEELGEC
jgi:hypothetical protein